MWGATTFVNGQFGRFCDFNPRSPCGERQGNVLLIREQKIFQSTLPVWGATGMSTAIRKDFLNFNPRSPCGERLDAHEISHRTDRFQSTLPVWGATGDGVFDRIIKTYFNPRSPCGERRSPSGRFVITNIISIHAPRVGSDYLCKYLLGER